MLKTRIIPTLLYKDHGLVKGVGFDSWRRVGTALPAIKVYCTREVDELVLVDVSATLEGRLIDLDTIDSLADECFMPLTVGGGVRSPDDFRNLLRVGADKVAVNSAVLENPQLIADAASQFGSQCVVVSIDFRRIENPAGEVVARCGSKPTGLEVVDWARQVETLGAGEILLTSIDRDGTMSGYDIEVVKSVSSAVSIPVIASGGAGSCQHMLEAITVGGASAVAAGSVFHFTEMTPLEAKRYLAAGGVPVRL